MNDDDPVCLCFHVSKRKIVGYCRRERPQVEQHVPWRRCGAGVRRRNPRFVHPNEEAGGLSAALFMNRETHLLVPLLRQSAVLNRRHISPMYPTRQHFSPKFPTSLPQAAELRCFRQKPALSLAGCELSQNGGLEHVSLDQADRNGLIGSQRLDHNKPVTGGEIVGDSKR